MDTAKFLEQLLQTGRDMANQGRGLAEQKLGVPAAGAERDAMMSGLGKGAAAAGVLAMLLGTKGGRKLTGSALKLGSLAAIGTVAYKAYQQWQSQQANPGSVPAPEPPIGQLTGPAQENRSRALLRALIGAAKADGHIDTAEQAAIDAELAKMTLDPDTLHFIKAEIDRPLDAAEVAAAADSQEAALEIYATSMLVINQVNDQERAYLNQLATALKLPPSLVALLEKQATAA
jgi:uncharacterized membrane protein YebE (DUF533 family)